MITETGQIVQLNVEEEHKPGPRLVQTQLQLMVVQIVMEMRLKLRTVTNKNAQVKIQPLVPFGASTKSHASGKI